MSTPRLLFAGLAVASGYAVAAHAESISLKLRPGLWELTTSAETAGTMPIPPELLARIPPERRAKFEAAMAASQARMAKPHTFKQCITEASLRRGIDLNEDVSARCQNRVLSSTGSAMDVSVQCKGQRETTSGTFHFVAAGPETVNGTITMTMSDGARSMTIKRVMSGHWASADCGSVKAAGE